MTVTRTLASLTSGVPRVRLIRRPFEPDHEPRFTEYEPEEPVNAEIVEGDELRVLDVQCGETSNFSYFVDGAQATRLAFYEGPLPGYLAFINAAVLVRKGSQMANAPVLYGEMFAVFAPSESRVLAMVPREGLFAGVPVECGPDLSIAGMAEAVKNAISTARERLEHELKNRWLQQVNDGWLLADGGVAQLCSANPGFHPVVGVVKSHRKQYFQGRAAVELVLGLKTGQRTAVFKAISGSEKRDVAWSWYLRLRDDPSESPVFGLVRIEMPPVDETLRWVEPVSQWLLAERTPLSLPDHRYDRLLYPIRLVEANLKARQPSEAMFLGLIGA